MENQGFFYSKKNKSSFLHRKNVDIYFVSWETDRYRCGPQLNNCHPVWHALWHNNLGIFRPLHAGCDKHYHNTSWAGCLPPCQTHQKTVAFYNLYWDVHLCRYLCTLALKFILPSPDDRLNFKYSNRYLILHIKHFIFFFLCSSEYLTTNVVL